MENGHQIAQDWPQLCGLCDIFAKRLIESGGAKLIVIGQSVDELLATMRLMDVLQTSHSFISEDQTAAELEESIDAFRDPAGSEILLCWVKAIPTTADLSAMAHEVVFLGEVPDAVYDKGVALTDRIDQMKTQTVLTSTVIENVPDRRPLVAIYEEEIQSLAMRRTDTQSALQTPSQIRQISRAENAWSSEELRQQHLQT